jgi:sulfur carrier protein
MEVTINGEVKKFPLNTTLFKVLKELSLDGKVMAAAVNMTIVKQNSWESYILNDGDKVELLDFVGGG